MFHLVLDVGKTHIKLYLVDNEHQIIDVRQSSNRVCNATPYPHFDIDRIWSWFITQCRDLSQNHLITSVFITTHGAAAVLLVQNPHGDLEPLPVLDYEFEEIYTQACGYNQLRPPYGDSLSPDLPAGLNLGRQLYWLQQNHPNWVDGCKTILLYPQFWVWKLTGQLVSERTSLGCHTDLWAPKRNDFSELAKRQGWSRLFPPFAQAGDCIGPPLKSVQSISGLTDKCHVYAGIHDSNASLLRYLLAESSEPCAVVSTGTWSIAMSLNQKGLDELALQQKRDMLANVNIYGSLVPCSRAMLGREYAEILRLCGGGMSDQATFGQIEYLIQHRILALPSFVAGCGPFSERQNGIVGKQTDSGEIEEVSVPPEYVAALATLYCALVMDYQLALLQAQGPVYIEGGFVKNTLMCQLLASLRREVYMSEDPSGTVKGCVQLIDSNSVALALHRESVTGLGLSGLEEYRELWFDFCSPSSSSC